MDKTIYLIRHGKINFGKEKKYIGSTDLQLDQMGVEQAYKLGQYFSDTHIKKIYTSPMKRCIQTSDIIIKDRKIDKIIMDGLREIHLGEWENKTFNHIRKEFPSQYEQRGKNLENFIVPGGESFSQLQKRVMPVFEEIIDNGEKNILIVAHAGVNRVILQELLKIPFNKIMNIKQAYACINRLSYDDKLGKWMHKLEELEGDKGEIIK